VPKVKIILWKYVGNVVYMCMYGVWLNKGEVSVVLNIGYVGKLPN
jgi:hypothetical protein